jgi:hypothetical protein
MQKFMQDDLLYEIDGDVEDDAVLANQDTIPDDQQYDI